MEREEIAHPIRFRRALPIIVPKFDRGAVAVGHHRHQPVDRVVREVEVGPFERFDHGGGIADRNAIAVRLSHGNIAQ